jgi:hypothetical protein
METSRTLTTRKLRHLLSAAVRQPLTEGLLHGKDATYRADADPPGFRKSIPSRRVLVRNLLV